MPEYQFHQFLTGASCRQAHWRREDLTAKLQPTVALGCSSVGLTEIWFPRKLDRSWKRQISHPLETEEKAALKAVPFVQVLDDVGLNFWKKKKKNDWDITGHAVPWGDLGKPLLPLCHHSGQSRDLLPPWVTLWFWPEFNVLPHCSSTRLHALLSLMGGDF